MVNKEANPVPLGLMGFGMTAILMNLHNIGLFQIDGIILAMGMFLGGICQIIAGILCYKRGDTFGVTTFTLYGLYWLSQVAIFLMPFMGLPESSATSSAWYLLLWGVFTGFMFIGTLRAPFVARLQFATLGLLYLLLAMGNFTGISSLFTLAGVLGIISGLSGIYIAVAQVLNEELGEQILPFAFVPCDKKG